MSAHGDTDLAQIWQIGEGGQNAYRCTATVISPHRVLTATHCFTSDVREYYVQVGRTELGQGSKYGISGSESRGDLTVLVIDQAMEIKLPYPQLAPNEPVRLRMHLWSHGWGRTCSTCGPSEMLRAADTIVNDNEPLPDLKGGGAYRVAAIQPAIGGHYTRLHHGDSGGPSSTQPDANGPRVIYGVASMAQGTGNFAYMSATYDMPGHQPVHDWLREFGQMTVYQPPLDNGVDEQGDDLLPDTDVDAPGEAPQDTDVGEQHDELDMLEMWTM